MGKWKTLSTRVAFKNPWFMVREDQVIMPDGKAGIYYVVESHPFVIILPITRKNEIYLIHISRYTTNKTHWELPAGSTDNQDSLFAAKRELKEETGLTSENWIYLGELEVAPGMSSQVVRVFAAKDVIEKNVYPQKDESIDKLKKVSFRKALEMIENGEIVDSQIVSAIMLGKLKLKWL